MTVRISIARLDGAPAVASLIWQGRRGPFLRDHQSTGDFPNETAEMMWSRFWRYLGAE